MCSSTDYTELVEKSQQGDDESLNRLAESARSRLYTYVFRLTMREELTQDVVQESLLEMFKFLDKLECADRFWPWLRRIAINKIRHHYSREKQRRTVSLSGPGMEGSDGAVPDGLANLVTEELRQIVMETMSLLKARYREVLVMRCYEEMDYGAIADELGCSEFSARVLFFRAKKALAKQLSRRGLGKGALLTALVIFGKLTAPSEAAAAEITVTAAAMQVGTAAALVGSASTKAVVVSLAAAGVFTVGTAVMGPLQEDSSPSVDGVRVENVIVDGQGNVQANLLETARNVQQCWYFFPDGAQGSVMMRQLMPDASAKQSYCLWLQNHVGNYYYDTARGIVHMNNYRVWSKTLGVTRLPTDSAELTAFLDEMEGKRGGVCYGTAVEPGGLVIVAPDERSGRASMQIVRHPSVLYEEYFQYGWPGNIRMVDDRDEMHRRGWTWFAVEGEIAGRKVTGAGRLPFVYGAATANPPWLALQIDGHFAVCDGPEGTYTFDPATGVLTTYAEGSFLRGMARPWMGLHAVDTIRRDAAEARVRFESRYTEGTGVAEVELLFDRGRAVYTIDMRADLVRSIQLSVRDARGIEQQGVLNFRYVEAIDDVKDELMTPKASGYVSARSSDGPLWLLQFAEGTLSR